MSEGGRDERTGEERCGRATQEDVVDGGKGEGGISAGTVREQRDTGQSDQLLCNMEKSAKEKVRQDGLMQEANGKGSNSDARKCRQGNVSQRVS